jgi:imidazolonepropionase-like amidohydrolase
MRYWKNANENRLEWMRRFHQRGGVLLVGTDFQWGGITLHQELRNFAAIGMNPVEAIAAATGECAKAFRMEHELGTISEGLRADIVVLNRGPMEDIGALRDIAHVLKDGSMVWSAGAGPHGHI